MRFLIDECLSPALCDIAHQAGYEAYHVVQHGLAGAKDYQLRQFMLQGEFILVTNNWKDVDQLLGESELHPGLMIIRPNVPRERQTTLFRALLAAAVGLADLINKILEVNDAGNVRAYERPTRRSG